MAAARKMITEPTVKNPVQTPTVQKPAEAPVMQTKIPQNQTVVPPKNQTPVIPVIKTGTPTPSKTGYSGGSISDYLTSVGQDASRENRTTIAAKNGITGYLGTAEQNTALLKKLRGY
jgi:hypothetical protein